MTIEERLAELENKFAAMSVAQQAAGDPSGYYTSIYSGEQIDTAIGGVLEGNIPNLSGSTIPVSPSDQTSIDTALSNKVPIINHGDTNVSLLDRSLSDGLHVCSDWADCPTGLTDSQGICLAITYLHYEDLGQYWGRRIYFPTNDGQAIYVNNCSVDVWQGWDPIATATPPQEYDLPLAEGITTTQHCVYHKNQFSEVSVRGIASGNIVNGVLIATLPVGFRPAYALEYPATFAADGDRPAGTISVGTDGTIRAQVVSSSFAVIFSASFIALS